MHTIQGASFPNFANTTQRRYFELSGRRYTLKSPPLALGGATYVNVLVWERLD